MLIAHPPCTYLTVSGNRWFNVERYGEKALERIKQRENALDFFIQLAEADIPMIAVENPVGYVSTHYRRPDQIIQPYQFGHPYTKQTCLWLKGLPKLVPTDVLQKPECGWENEFVKDGRYVGFIDRDSRGKILAWGSEEIKKLKSKTYIGIAKAMAEQWG